jgi:hypothetical protein
MSRVRRGFRIVLTLLMVILLALSLTLGLSSLALAESGSGSGGGSGDSGSGSATRGDFSLTANYRSPAFVGHLVRGGLPDCPDCTTAIEPRYLGTSFSCFYDSNTLSLASLNGFSGTVTLEILNLPPGVTSWTAASMVVPRRGAVSTPLSLRAEPGAAVGDATVTVRATSGGLVHSLSLPIRVADQLPACP